MKKKLSAQIAAVALAAGAAVILAACSSSGTTLAASAAASTPALSGSIDVFAAASLKATFTTLANDFQTANPGVKVATNFAGSSDLVTQIQGGAPADVMASADTATMKKLTDANLIEGTPVNFATNVLEIAVPPSNPAGITSFADLAKPGVKTVVCAPQVPCGAATVTVEQAAGVTINPVSQESSVTDVLGKVTSGEADAGLVYVTDVLGAGSSVKGITFPESSQAVNTYPIATVSGSKASDIASAFIAYVTGPDGQKVLAAAGFGKP
jgi:molybdate transport system substrate-binding protein